jgi:hypothetical protein
VAEDPPPNNGPQEQPPARQDVDVILDVSELEVDRIKLTVRNLRAHVSVLAELASLLSLQVGVDARLEDTELEIEGVRAKLLRKGQLRILANRTGVDSCAALPSQSKFCTTRYVERG